MNILRSLGSRTVLVIGWCVLGLGSILVIGKAHDLLTPIMSPGVALAVSGLGGALPAGFFGVLLERFTKRIRDGGDQSQANVAKPAKQSGAAVSADQARARVNPALARMMKR